MIFAINWNSVIAYMDDTTNNFLYNMVDTPDSKVHGANMDPTWVLSAPGGPHVGPMKLAIWDS